MTTNLGFLYVPMQGHNRAGLSWDGPVIDNAAQETQRDAKMNGNAFFFRLPLLLAKPFLPTVCGKSESQLFAKILRPHLCVGEDGEGMEQGFSVAGQDLLFASTILLSYIFWTLYCCSRMLQNAHSSTSFRGRPPRKWSHGYFPKTISSLSHRRLNDGKKSGIPFQSTHCEERIIQNLRFLPKES